MIKVTEFEMLWK